MNKLTIGILFCDKDYQYIEKLIESIEKKVQVSYDIILYDNREKTHEEINFKNYRVLGSNGKNEFQLKARAEIIDAADSEYIWFIDADDDICYVYDRLNELHSSIIVFGYFIEDKTIYRKKEILESNYHNGVEDSGGQIWNKWIKTSILKSISPIIRDKEMISGEDVFILILALNRCKFIETDKALIYRYNCDRSAAWANSYSSFEKFSSILKKDKLKDVVYSSVDNRWLKEKGFTEYLEYGPAYLFAFINEKSKDDWDKIADAIFDRYTPNEMLTSYAIHFDNLVWTRESFEFTKNKFKEKIPYMSDDIIKRIQKKYNKTPKFITFSE